MPEAGPLLPLPLPLPMPLPLALSRHRLLLAPEAPMRVPRFPGSTWRGAMGWALKRLVCVMRGRPCEGCPLEHSCILPTVFAARPEETAVKMRLYERVPNPFVLHPRFPAGPVAGPEDRVILDLTLVGRACGQVAYIVRALQSAAEGGLGPDRTALTLVAVGPASEPWPAGDALPGLQGLVAEGFSPRVPPPPETVTVRLTSPLRLQRDGRLVGPKALTPADLFGNLVRRVSMLAHFHAEADLALDFRGLRDAAHGVPMLDAALEWQELARRSTRQGGALVPMGGVIGRLILDLRSAPELWPFLWLGQWIGAGKGASMGLGAYRLEGVGP